MAGQNFPFETGRVLGEGSFGRVVETPELGPSGEKLVYKIINISSLTNQSTCNLEIELFKRLRHINIVAYHGHHFQTASLCTQGQEDASEDNLDYLFIKMEACDRNFGELLGSLPTQKHRNTKSLYLYNLLEQMSTGLAYIHSMGVIHRDFNPRNILLKGNTIKIGDFGLSTVEDELTGKSRTVEVGTRMYRAPEVDSKHYDKAVDIFSFGLVILETLHSFGEGKAQVFQDIRERQYWTEEVEECFKSLKHRESVLFVLMTRFIPNLRPTAEDIRSWISTSIKIMEGRKQLTLDYSKLEKLWAIPVEESRIEFDTTQSIEGFIGRKTLLQDLKGFFNQKVGFVVLHGLSGIGKTSLALQFLQEVGSKTTNGISNNTGRLHLCRLAFDTESSLVQSIIQLSIHPGVGVTPTEDTGKQKDALTLLREVICVAQNRWIKEKRQWLLFLDNFDEFHSLGRSVIEALKESSTSYPSLFFVLVTTQKRDILDNTGIFSMRKLEIQKWDDTEAAEFVNEALKPFGSSQNHIKKLCHQLENSPMALTQAVAYIKQESIRNEDSSFSIEDYLEILDKLDSSLYVALPEAQKTLTQTFRISYNRLQSEEERIVLQILSYFNPNAIPYAFLSRLLLPESYSGSSFTHTSLENSLKSLKSYSLIRIESKVVLVHRLVQKYARNLDTSKSVLEDVTLWTNKLAVYEGKPFEPEDLNQLLPFWEHLKQRPGPPVESFKYFPYIVASRLFQGGKLLQLLPFAESALNFIRNEVGPGDTAALRLHRYYGEALREFGLWDDAAEVLEDALEFLKGQEEQEEDVFLSLKNTLGLVFDRAGRFRDAGNVYSSILKVLYKKNGDQGSAESCTAMNNLAGIMVKLDNEENKDNGEREWTKQALTMYKNVLEWQRTNLPGKDRHPMTLATLNNLSLCQHYLGQNENAKKNLEIVLKAFISRQGEGHPDTLECRDAYSKVLMAVGMKKEARAELQKVLDSRRLLHPPSHPLIVELLQNLKQWDEEIAFLS